jgi:hypothetical protein
MTLRCGCQPEVHPDMRQRFALDLTYARNLYGNKIAEASIDEIGKLKLGTAEKGSNGYCR